jgi:hypothetical protein
MKKRDTRNYAVDIAALVIEVDVAIVKLLLTLPSVPPEPRLTAS